MENTLEHVTLEEKLALEQLLKDMRAKKKMENTIKGDANLKEENFYTDLKSLTSKNVPKISHDEMELLKFCHERDMKKFIKEEFEKNPIDYSKLANDPSWMAQNKGGGYFYKMSLHFSISKYWTLQFVGFNLPINKNHIGKTTIKKLFIAKQELR